MKKVLIFLTAFLIIGILDASAETIELKNGKEIVAEILKERDDAVVVSKEGGKFIFAVSRDRIKNIRPSTQEEIKREKALKSAPPPATKAAVDKEEEKAKKEEIEKYRLERYEQQVLAAKKARGRIKIKFSEGRFGVVDATLNGKVTASLLVDTGASLVLISRDIAKRLGIDYTSDEYQRISMSLADGRVTTATLVTLDSVEVGSSKVKDVQVAIPQNPPGGGIDGLLGMTFLKYFHVKLDAKENCLVLEKY